MKSLVFSKKIRKIELKDIMKEEYTINYFSSFLFNILLPFHSHLKLPP